MGGMEKEGEREDIYPKYYALCGRKLLSPLPGERWGRIGEG
jgi:hypothetical protein